MKTCPQCQAEYDDYMRFCLQDGTPLVGGEDESSTEAVTEIYEVPHETNPQNTEAVTEEWRAPNESQETIAANNKTRSAPTNKFSNSPALVESEQRKSGSGFFPGALLLGGLLFLGSAIGGVFWYLSGQNSNETASANLNQANISNVTNSNQTPNFEISNANLSDGTNLPLENANVNKKSSPTPTATPKPGETKTPEKTPTPEIKPTPKPTEETTQTPTPTKPSRPVAGGVLNGKATNLPRPNYPQAARAVRAGGKVNVRVLVDENGNVVSANAVNGHPLLRNSAENAAHGAKFRPMILNGQPVKFTGVIVYNFTP